MTDMEKKVMVRLCAKIVAETDLYETDEEMQNLIDWVCLLEQKTGEYKNFVVIGIESGIIKLINMHSWWC